MVLEGTDNHRGVLIAIEDGAGTDDAVVYVSEVVENGSSSRAAADQVPSFAFIRALSLALPLSPFLHLPIFIPSLFSFLFFWLFPSLSLRSKQA